MKRCDGLYDLLYQRTSKYAMSTMSASEARKNLFPLLGQVNADHDVVRITSKAGNAVLISEADYEAWQTTRYLFSTPANVRHMLGSIQEWRQGTLVEAALPEEDEADE